MFERVSGKYVAAVVVTFAFHAGVAVAADAPHFGQPISPADAAAWDISIGPDGVGLPPGSGTPAQGAVVYAQKCAVCHGDKGEGKTNARLVGGQITGDGPVVKTVGSYWPYATTLFDFTRRAMPWTAPKSLTNDEVYAVTAHICSLAAMSWQRPDNGSRMNREDCGSTASSAKTM
jgi:cytochrome c